MWIPLKSILLPCPPNISVLPPSSHWECHPQPGFQALSLSCYGLPPWCCRVPRIQARKKRVLLLLCRSLCRLGSQTTLPEPLWKQLPWLPPVAFTSQHADMSRERGHGLFLHGPSYLLQTFRYEFPPNTVSAMQQVLHRKWCQPTRWDRVKCWLPFRPNWNHCSGSAHSLQVSWPVDDRYWHKPSDGFIVLLVCTIYWVLSSIALNTLMKL